MENQNNSAPAPQNLENSESSESSQQLNADGSPQAAAPEAVQAAIKKKLNKLKLKVDGKEYDEELPFEIDEDNSQAREYLTRQAQLAKASQKRMAEYGQLEKEVRSFIDELKKNPKKILSDPSIGVDIKKFAAQILEEEIENSRKSPEQLEKEKLENELRELKEQTKREKEEMSAKEFERLQEREYERYDQLMTNALEKTDLPKTPYTVKKIAEYMSMAVQNGLDVTPEDVIPLVREEMTNDLKEMFAVMPEDVIESIIGKDVVGKLRKKQLAKAKQAPPVPVKAAIKDVGQSSPKKPEAAPEKKTIRQMFGI